MKRAGLVKALKVSCSLPFIVHNIRTLARFSQSPKSSSQLLFIADRNYCFLSDIEKLLKTKSNCFITKVNRCFCDVTAGVFIVTM